MTVTVHSPGYFDGSGIAFFGFGDGLPNAGFSNEPLTSSSAYVRMLPTDFYPGIEFTNGPIMQERNDGLGDGTFRVRITWNALTQKISYSLQKDYTGSTFVPTYQSAEFSLNGIADVTDTNARIFFGGAGDATFDDLVILSLDCATQTPRGLSGQFKTMVSAARALRYPSVGSLVSSINKACHQ